MVLLFQFPEATGKKQYYPKANEIFQSLKESGFRVQIDDSDVATPGWKFSEWEMRGVPVRMEIGPKDIEKNQVVLVNRINREKSFIKIENIVEELSALFEKIQSDMFNSALKFREENTVVNSTLEELVNTIENKRGFVRSGWCGGSECETTVKDKIAATIRVIDEIKHDGLEKCLVCGKEAEKSVIFAKSY